MLAHINHPNFHWSLAAEEIMQVKSARFLEVYNGHPATRGQGDAYHASTERIWDIVLTWRLSRLGLGPIYAITDDDCHHYRRIGPNFANPGRGWIMVQAPRLAAVDLLKAMEAGEFYASTGVELKKVQRSQNALALEVEPEPDVTYQIQFICTRKGFNAAHQPVTDAKGRLLRTTHRYSDEVGAVLAEVNGTTTVYPLKDDEIYVRAKVISSRLKANPFFKDEHEAAWTQLLVTGVK